MNIFATLRDFMTRYGSPFTAEGAEFRGVFSPQNRASPDYLHTGAGELGAGVDGKLLLLAPPDAPLKKGGQIGCGGRNYAILAADDYLLAGEPLYRRAVLEQMAVKGERIASKKS